MSWDNPVFPKAAKNSIGFLVPFFLSYPRVVGGSGQGLMDKNSHMCMKKTVSNLKLNLYIF